jgi:hypothetical protein
VVKISRQAYDRGKETGLAEEAKREKGIENKEFLDS